MPLVYLTHLQCCVESDYFVFKGGDRNKIIQIWPSNWSLCVHYRRTVWVASNKIRREVFCSDTSLFLDLIFTVAVVNIQFEAHDFFT